MKPISAAGIGLIFLGLAACEGPNPFQGGGPTGVGVGTGGGGTVVDNTIPDELAHNLKRISYDGANALTVEIWALDNPVLNATYNRNAALDVPGYTAFSYQDDPLDRMFVALAAASPSGDLQAAAVSDGGQFNRYFRGGYYDRASAANLPTTGLVSYAGSYAGITNLDAPGGPNLLPVAPGTPSELIPGEPARTVGSIFLDVDFGSNAINGAIFNRAFVDGALGNLDSLTLTAADIDANGEFLGSVEFDGMPEAGTQGSYGGIIGGPNGIDEIAGIVYLTNIFIPNDVRDSPFDSEIGVFLLPRCGTAGAPAICNQVN